MIIEYLDKLLDYFGDVWRMLSDKDRRLIVELWLGYLQLGSNEMIKIFEAELNRAISTAPVRVPRLWQQIQFRYSYDLTSPVPFQYIGRQAMQYTATSEPIVEISWALIS